MLSNRLLKVRTLGQLIPELKAAVPLKERSSAPGLTNELFPGLLTSMPILNTTLLGMPMRLIIAQVLIKSMFRLIKL